MAIELRHHYGPRPRAVAQLEAVLNKAREEANRSVRTPAAAREAQILLDALAAPLVAAMVAGIWPPMPMMILTDGDAVRVRMLDLAEMQRP